MPKELIWGDTVTVRRGDLDVLRARTRDDLLELSDLLDPAIDPATDRERDLLDQLATTRSDLTALRLAYDGVRRDRDRLFHRAQLYATFVESLARFDAPTPLDFAVRWAEELTRLGTALAATPPGSTDDATDPTEPTAFVPDDGGAELVRQLAATHTAYRALQVQHNVLRRRHQLLSLFVEQLEAADQAAETHDEFTRVFRHDVGHLRVALGRVPLVSAGPGDDLTGDDPSYPDTQPQPDPAFPTTEPPTDAARQRVATALDIPVDAVTPSVPNVSHWTDHTPITGDRDDRGDQDDLSDELVELQLFLQLGWERDAGTLQVGIKGHDHETGHTYDLGGHFLSLDWAGTNKAVKKFRVARDQSWGAPE